MKLLNQESEGFKPFELNLLVETEEETRLLWHVFNRLKLRDIIFNDNYGTDLYIMKIADDFDCENIDKITETLENHVKIKK